MAKIIGVRFREAGKVYYFDPEEQVFEKGQGVIVETARGVEYGEVVFLPYDMDDDKLTEPLKPIIRIAGPADIDRVNANRAEEKEAYRIAKEKIALHGLEMKLIDAEYTLDRSKLLFYFTAEGRVDFRELVKDLAAVFRTRIELRQIGVRDETKLRGGLGVCGRPLCCTTWLPDFVPVSIKMAKEQNLSLNPVKISGVCGRLMCCLKNEQDTYEYLNANLPDVGAFVNARDGAKGVVHSLSVLRQKVKIIIETEDGEKEIREYPVEELVYKPSKKKEKRLSDEEYKKLKKLEEGGK